MSPGKLNLVGMKFGRLTVVRQVESLPKRQWLCSCECGGEKIVSSHDLTGGAVKSCGCLHRPRLDKRRPPLLGAWLRLRAKCLNPNNRAYKWLGAKGITLLWPNYKAFRQWAEEAGYQPGCFLVRRDRNKDFGPENCFWSETRPKHSSVTVTNRAVIRSDGKRFRSLADALRATPGAVSGTITATCRGRRKSHASYGWRYADEKEAVQ